MQFEYEKYIERVVLEKQNNKIAHRYNIYNQIINNFFEDLILEEAFIEELRSKTIKYKKLTVFMGNQLSIAVDFLVSLLNEMDIYCKKILMGQIAFDNITRKYILNKEPYFWR